MDGAERLRATERTLAEAGIEASRFEAQLLLALALGVSRTAILAETYPEPSEAQWAEFERLVTERAKRVPLAYLRGRQEFYGLSFVVGPAVLIPRPETELLVEFALERLKEHPAKQAAIADVGTGSGCIAIAVLAHLPTARAVAFDLSAEALTLARNNATINSVTDRVCFVRADTLSAARTTAYDLIVSNPPYIPTAEIPTLQTEVRAHEPHLALDGGEEGLTVHRHLAAGARRALRPGGWLAVEVAMGQAQAVASLYRDTGLKPITIRRDLAGIERLVAGQKPSPG